MKRYKGKKFISKPINFFTLDGYSHFIDKMTKGGLKSQRVDLVLSCVDNYAARMSINAACNSLDQIWIESGVSEDAVSSHIQIMIPGETACFCCATPLAIVEDNEADIKREGVCAASLPTTMGITAGFMAQNTLKFLLEFGEITFCLSYNARLDFFNNYKIMPNPECKDRECVERQKEKAKIEGVLKKLEKKKLKENEEKNIKKEVHALNEWGIELVKEKEEVKKEEQGKNEISEEERKNESLEDLMSKLKGL